MLEYEVHVFAIFIEHLSDQRLNLAAVRSFEIAEYDHRNRRIRFTFDGSPGNINFGHEVDGKGLERIVLLVDQQDVFSAGVSVNGRYACRHIDAGFEFSVRFVNQQFVVFGKDKYIFTVQ